MIVSLIACGAENATPAMPATVTASFATATPGGSISVWLLTTTPTLEGQPRLSITPLAPNATATAETELATGLAVAAIAPDTLTPAIVPEQCPPLSAATLPVAVPPIQRYPEVIRNFLTVGGAPTLLETKLRNWEAITVKGGLVRADRDFTGDGAPETLVVALDPVFPNRSPQPGNLFVFSCENHAVRLIYDWGYRPDGGAPALFSVDDLNGDGIDDLLFTAQSCVAPGCFAEAQIIGWNSALKRFDNLSGGPVGAYQPSIAVADAAGGAKEISITGAPNPDPAAGPPRTITTVLRWDGSAFVVAQILKSPPQYRIQAIHDGDDALAAGDGNAAADLYLRAAEASDLLDWGIPDEAALLSIYARYRLMLAYTLANRLDQAQATHDQLILMFAPPATVEGQPTPFPVSQPSTGIEFVNMADLFWQNFAINRDMKRACAGVIDYVRAIPSALTPLNSFGYANKQYAAQELCPLGQ